MKLVTSNVSIDKLQWLNSTLDQFCVGYEKAFAARTFTYSGKVKLSFSNIHVVFWPNCLNSATIQHYNIRRTVRCYWIFTW